MSMTITTALFDLNRTDWRNYNRSIDDYKRYSQGMLSLDCKMVVYTSPDLRSYFEEKRREIDPDLTNTKIVTMDLDQIPYYDMLGEIQNVMSSDWFISNIKNRHDVFRPEANYAIYNAIQFAKSKFLVRSIEENPFSTDLHCWLDVSAYHDGFPPQFLRKKYPARNTDELLNGKIHHFYKEFPKDSDADKVAYYGMPNDVRMVGGWFGGTHDAMRLYSELIEKVVKDSLAEGVISDDQNIYTICYLENKDKFHLHDGRNAHNPCFAGVDHFIE